MTRCSNQGCGQEFNPAHNPDDGCTYHSGGPVFHEGLKSWSCCQNVNKPVLDFDEFMQIPGCTVGQHNAAAPKPQPASKPAQTTENLSMSTSADGKEVYTSGPAASSIPKPMDAVAAAKVLAPAPVEEEDDLQASVAPGTKCRHNGCSVEYVSDEVSRKEGGEASECTYHPLPPIFREGSKGYLCCKRRVLEFDEFLKIGGCKKGRHVFVAKARPQEQGEQFTDCRIDHYQTPSEVHVSVFGKQADKERSKVEFEETQIHIDIYLPQSKRFRKSIELFGPIDPQASTYKVYGTKVEILLKKHDTRSWTILEKPQRDLGPISLTFGVGGRTGTIGGKELVLDDTNKTRATV
ncbi:chord-domain-containing protein [Heliocybe sulcata]|uniref:Chord-domain-containing protein n=1 Tax=Heliocybe sulcata TaxID=5364 RepID=A0A5C3NGK9_9AGAM|nr:chord-domain-containing protein [Heliocybe sulcata]